MKSINHSFCFFILSALVLISLGATGPVAAQEQSIVCIPTCSAIDGRMLSLASVGFKTLAGQTISLQIGAPGTMSSFEISIFDGDTSGMWDIGTTPLVYTLYADPLRNGEGLIQLDQWLGSSMADNTWTDLTISQDSRAMAPSGDYFYQIKINLPDAATVIAFSNFKIGSNAPIELAMGESFAYSALIFKLAEVKVIYPQYPLLTSTTYDGTWDMYINVPVSTPNFLVYDGDMDYGSFDCSTNDTNDPDTPDDVLPAWAIGISDVPEGVPASAQNCRDAAGNVITGPQGQVYTTSDPADDYSSVAFQRSPSVTYDVIDPNGNVYHNENPSGTEEWEQFRITSDPNTPADYHMDGFLPAGTYHVRIRGLDMTNLNAWHFDYDQLCVYEDGTPCVPLLHPYELGDTVWHDANGNSIQDAGEAGIPGVTVTLLDANGNALPNGTATTDANGRYSFGVDAGTYSVQIDLSNFQPGSALAGYFSTTPGGNTQTNTVTTDNLLTYDFGYGPFAVIGDFVWNDLNGNGIQEDSEPGMAGIIVNLLGSDSASVVASMTTDTTGYYRFTNLLPGTYSVQFVAPVERTFTTANAGADDTKDSDADPAGKTAAITLSIGETNTSVDVGLTPPASIGDFVWNDLNGNGLQDDGEPGIAGITVNLLGSDGISVIASTVTDASGRYTFTGLLSGTYYLQFIAPAETTFTTANAGNEETKDNDAGAAGKTAAITLGVGEAKDAVDAGLKESLSLSCPDNLVLNPSFELSTGKPKYWTNGTAGPINVPVVDGKHAGYISGSGTMYQKVKVTPGSSYTLTFYSGSHKPSIQTVKIQYYTSWGKAIGTAATHIITSDLEVTGFGGPYTLTLDTAPAKAAYMKLLVSANRQDFAKVDKFCLQTETQPATASIGDFIWDDLNGNGIQDDGEPSLAGVTVKLLGSDGTSVVASTTTDAAGAYSFSRLLSGTYYVQFVAPAEKAFTVANAGGDDAMDSDANAITGRTAAIVLSVGETNTSVDAGLKGSSGLSCPGNLILNPSFELNTGSPSKYWTNGTAAPINVPVVDGRNAGYISGSGTMYQKVNVILGNTYTLTFYSGSHNPWKQTVKLQYYDSNNTALGAAAVHTITNDLETAGFGGPYNLSLAAAPSAAASLKIMVSANNYDYAKVDMLCLQTAPSAQINRCSYIRSPGFWKNYSNHMSDAAFLELISHTQDFSGLTVQQALAILSTNKGLTNLGIPELDGVNASYLKFLLSSELNAAWNGREDAAAAGGMLGAGNYHGTGLTVDQVLHQAYLDRYNSSSTQKRYLEYLSAGGENADQNACLVQP